MSKFLGYEFMYNNILSSKFGLMIAYMDYQAGEEFPLSPAINLVGYKLPRRSKIYQLGTEVEGDGNFEFQISFFREQDKPFLASERDAVSQWLSSNYSFKPLRIIQDDLCSIYYNCFFKNIKHVAFGGYTNGFAADVICDAPFAWKTPQVIEKRNTQISKGYYQDITKIDIYNTSSDHNLTVPTTIEIDLGENCTGFRLINKSNNNEYFEFKNLFAGERIKIDNLFCIESITRPNTIILDNFSGEFLRLVNGLNHLTIEGQVKRVKIVYQSGRKIG